MRAGGALRVELELFGRRPGFELWRREGSEVRTWRWGLRSVARGPKGRRVLRRSIWQEGGGVNVCDSSVTLRV
eukprot:220224-Chlamydomonas_euryale.AAC.2